MVASASDITSRSMALDAKVSTAPSVPDSVVVLVNGLNGAILGFANELKEAITAPSGSFAKVQAVIDSMKATSDDITKNTHKLAISAVVGGVMPQVTPSIAAAPALPDTPNSMSMPSAPPAGGAPVAPAGPGAGAPGAAAGPTGTVAAGTPATAAHVDAAKAAGVDAKVGEPLSPAAASAATAAKPADKGPETAGPFVRPKTADGEIIPGPGVSPPATAVPMGAVSPGPANAAGTNADPARPTTAGGAPIPGPGLSTQAPLPGAPGINPGSPAVPLRPGVNPAGPTPTAPTAPVVPKP